MGGPHVGGAVRVVEVDDHRIKYLRLQINDLVIPLLSNWAVAVSSSVQ